LPKYDRKRGGAPDGYRFWHSPCTHNGMTATAAFQVTSPAAPIGQPAPRGESLVLLIAGGPLAWSVANSLAHRFGPLTVIIEEPESKARIIRRRARMLGWAASLGQAACGVILRLMQSGAAERQRAICAASGLETRPATGLTVHAVPSVNSQACRELLRRLDPEVVAVYGTRIIKPDTLACIEAPFINYHAGINPKYRGQHPAYWALVAGDAENAGVTVHLVDRGVDTGDVLYQAPVAFDRRDTIQTYQWVQLGTALPLFARAVEDALDGRLAPHRVALPSAQHFPPTLWTYLWNGLTKRVW
jgi:folate-dependent phosphoribosylglycinamide formyltransferase PurN